MPVVIEDDVWVGANVTILKGVTIGRGSVIAAGGIVNKSTPPYSINGGVPAKTIRFRFTFDDILEHERILYPENERYTREELEKIFAETKTKQQYQQLPVSLELRYDCRWSDKADDKFISDYIFLQQAVFQNRYSKELFKKKYIDNIYGQSIIIIVYGGDKPIAARAFWRNDIDGIEAYQPGDVCVLEECRGKGVFTEKTKRAFAMLEKDTIIYTYPNPNSFPAHLKMGNKLIASYYPRLFSHKRYQKEHTLKLDKEYAKWWLTSNDRI